MIPSGNLTNNFNAGFVADTEITVYYHNAFFMLNGGFATNALARNIPVVLVDDQREATWPSRSNALHTFIGANIGENLFVVDEISFYPFAGVGYGFIEPNLKAANSDPVLSALKINSFVWNAGISIDYNFPDKDYDPAKINRIIKVGLRYQLQKPSHEKKMEGFDLTLRFAIGSTMPDGVY